eukprot:TRINITY_DN15969_c0_g1_i1.p1 TRINITY_DN15969_c0_g1~~TRINITY_DN15969_c0_g1_i1.p1  ORF type:complete len:221 (+),score=19.18 TRINITY_DN15969_c0_g1_i1:66-728(+)
MATTCQSLEYVTSFQFAGKYTSPTVRGNDNLEQGQDETWPDIQHRYREKEDVWELFFIRTTSDMIRKQQYISKNVRGFFNREGKLLMLRFLNPDTSLGVHFYVTPIQLKHRTPCALKAFCRNEALEIYFTGCKPAEPSKTPAHLFVQFYRNQGRIIGIRIPKAAEKIRAKHLKSTEPTLSNDDCENNNDCKNEAKRIPVQVNFSQLNAELKKHSIDPDSY